MDSDQNRTSHRWIYILITIFFLAPAFTALAPLVSGFLPNAVTTVHATKPGTTKDNGTNGDQPDHYNSSNTDDENGTPNTGSSSIKDDPSDNQKSPWNIAVGQLSSTAVSDDSTAASGQVSLSDALGSGLINAWSFMGPANTNVWVKNDNSSWATSFQSLIPNKRTKSDFSKSSSFSKQDQEGYQVAARFAYAMQSSGLDRPVKGGFSTSNGLSTTGGWVLQLSYYVLEFSNGIFRVLITILKDINPLHWVIQAAEDGSGSASNTSYQQGLTYIDQGTTDSTPGFLQPLQQAVVTYYGWFTAWGWIIMAMFLAGGLGMGAMGITIGSSGGYTGQGKALASTMATFFKRLFVWVAIPIFAASLYNMCVDSLDHTFSTDNGGITSYAIYGAFVDYGDWVFNSRLAIPPEVGQNSDENNNGLDASFAAADNGALSHEDILAINYYGAGQSLSTIYNDVDGQTYNQNSTTSDALLGNLGDSNNLTANPNNTITAAQSNGSDDYNPDQDAADRNGTLSGLSLLKAWASGTTMTAANYASAIAPSILANIPKSTSANPTDNTDMAQELIKAKYNTNGTNKFSGSYTTLSTTGANNDVIAAPQGSENYNSSASPTSQGGLSTLGLYNYLLTTASDSGMTISATDNLADDISLPAHYTANLAGTGMISTGNMIWAIGMMGGLAILIAGYAFEILKSIIHGLPAMVFALLQTGLASIKGGVQLISVVCGIILGTLGSAFLYRFAQIAFISLAEYSDDVVHNSMFNTAIMNVLTVGHHVQVGGLSSVATHDTLIGAMNIMYGLFLLFVAVILLRYRGIILSSIASIIEETVNKILASFGSVSGTGSAGTRGAISQNTNSSNTWGNTASSVITRGGMGMLMAGGAAGGLAGLGKAAKGAGKGAGKGKGIGGTGKSNLGGKGGSKAALASGNHNTSAGKTGHAASAMGNKGTGNNAASALGKQNGERNGSNIGGHAGGLGDSQQHAAAGQGQGQDQSQSQGQLSGNVNGETQGGNGNSSTTQQNFGSDNNGQDSGLGQQTGDTTNVGGENSIQNTGPDQLGNNSNGMGQSNTGDNVQTNQNAGNRMASQNSSRNLSNQGDIRQMDNNNSPMGQNGVGSTNQTNENQSHNSNPQMNNNTNTGERMSDLNTNSSDLGGNGMDAGITNNSSENNNSNLGQENSPSGLGQNIDNSSLDQSDSRMDQNDSNDMNNIGDSGSNDTANAEGTNVTQNEAGTHSSDLTNNSTNVGQGLNGAGDTSNINNNDSSLNQGGNVGTTIGGTGNATAGANAGTVHGNISNSNLQNATNQNGMSSISGDNLNTTNGDTGSIGGSSDLAGTTGADGTAIGAVGDGTTSQLGGTSVTTGGIGGDTTNSTTLGANNTTQNGLGGAEAQASALGDNATIGGGSTIGDATSGQGVNAIGDNGTGAINNTSNTLGNNSLNSTRTGGGQVNSTIGGQQLGQNGTTAIGQNGTEGVSSQLGGANVDNSSSIGGVQGGDVSATTGDANATYGNVQNGDVSNTSSTNGLGENATGAIGGVQPSGEGVSNSSSIGGTTNVTGDNINSIGDTGSTGGGVVSDNPTSTLGGANAGMDSGLAGANQPITGDMPQAGWVSGGESSNLSVGTANNAMNSVYNAQQGVTQATQQYGAGSPQVATAQGALQSAQQGAISSGLSPNVVSNPQAVEAAHAEIQTADNNIPSGTIGGGGGTPSANTGSTGNTGGGTGDNGGAGDQRSIGI